MTRQTYDKEKAKINLARLETHGHEFEVVIEPDKAMAYKKGESDNLREVLKSENVYHDAKKGKRASEKLMEEVFDTSEPLEVAEKIVEEGRIQLTSEYREKLREEKKKKIIDMIHRYSFNPQNDNPHPRKRIENALKEAKVNIDEQETAEDQVRRIVDSLRPVLPIKFEVKQVQIVLESEHAAKLYGAVKNYGDIIDEEWKDDGSWVGVVEMPGGLETELNDELNDATHGKVETKVIKTK